MSKTAINLNTITSNTLTASTLSQMAYMSEAQLAAYTLPAGFIRLPVDLEKTSAGFYAVTFVNKETGQVVIAYRGSDTNAEKLMAAYSASTGTWDPQFTDATNYAKQARAAALDQINDYRADQGKPLLTVKDINPLVTGHSLGGLLGQVVSKMFGWRAEVFDSLGGGKLVTTQAFYDQAKVLGQIDADGKVVDYKVIGVIGVRFQLNPPAATTMAVNVDGLCFALKNIAKKPIRTMPRGQFSPKSPHAKACTHQRRPHHLSLQGVNLP